MWTINEFDCVFAQKNSCATFHSNWSRRGVSTAVTTLLLFSLTLAHSMKGAPQEVTVDVLGMVWRCKTYIASKVWRVWLKRGRRTGREATLSPAVSRLVERAECSHHVSLSDLSLQSSSPYLDTIDEYIDTIQISQSIMYLLKNSFRDWPLVLFGFKEM